MSSIQYLKTLAKDLNVASIAPTSTFGINKIFSCMDFQRAKLVVEYGPGGGVITKALLEHLRPDARLIAIETNDDFADHVEAEIDDPRFHLFRESAENVLDVLANLPNDTSENGTAEGSAPNADYIISGIPFSLFDVEKKDRILSATKEALGDEGSFLVYQFLISAGKPKHDIKKKLNQHMHIIKLDFEMRNIPPIRIYHAVNGTLAKQLKERTGE